MCPELSSNERYYCLNRIEQKHPEGFYDWTKRDIQPVIQRRDAFLLEMLKKEVSLTEE